MAELSKTLARCIQKAESRAQDFKVGLIFPDEGLVRTALRARENGVADSIAFSPSTIEGIETVLARSPAEAIEKALEFCLRGDLDSLVKGLVNTNIFLKGLVKSAFRTSYITHCSILDLPGYEKPIVVSDGTVTPYPDLAQKVEIVLNAIRCSRILGETTPKVAILSANELVLPGITSGSDAAVLSTMARRGQIAGAIVDGPMALDSALSPFACEKKGLSFSFAPPADVLIAPDLESAAMLIKAAVHLAGASVGGILWGTKCPIVLTSRADSDEAKYLSLCVCKLAAKAQ